MRDHHCGKCGLPVYFAELMQAAGRSWHVQCFRCANAECGRFMDSRSYNDHEQQLYCNHCYKCLFGPKGVGYGIGAGVLLTVNNKSSDVCESRDSSNDVIVTSSISYSDRKINQKPGYITHIDESFSSKTEANSGNGFTDQTHISPHLSKIKKTESVCITPAVICCRCSEKVYDAEKILAGGKPWHREKCFVCDICKKSLEPRTVIAACFAKEFGPKGYGRGVIGRIVQTNSQHMELV
ncbi:unnamed protein product [Thelazia callipaeda]|uniref:Cysteine-rich protein 1 n=1 Tax=Thelazia callipaeda TaxID=103827 RepID=A0A0N5CVS9_THECL|nr:unnamed protein product [Thelazia callipaeda]